MNSDLRFTVEHIQVRQKQYLSLVWTNDLGLPLHFIYRNLRFGKGWYCLEDGRKVAGPLTKLLDDAMKTVASGMEGVAHA